MTAPDTTHRPTIPLIRGNFVGFASAVGMIRQADLLLWHYTGGEFSRMIRRRAPPAYPYVHVGMAIIAGYEFGPIHSCDTQFCRGGQRRRLYDDVQRYPGKIEVWRMWPEVSEREANATAAQMEELIDRPYGWKAALAYGLRTTRWWPFINPLPDERLIADANIKPVCSQAVAIACRRGARREALPPGERMTMPWFLAYTRFARYQFTLVP